MSTHQPRPDPEEGPGREAGEDEGLPKAPPPGEPYGDNPYGGPAGAADPLAGMPPLANRGKRLVARVIDSIVVGVPVTLLMWPLVGNYGWDGDGGGGAYGSEAVVLVVYFIYEGLMLSARGQTLGKMAMRIRVAMLRDGAVPRGNPAWYRAGVYSLPQLLPCIGFVFWLVNVLNCTWDKPYRQCVHDKAARTVVVSTA
ncbi:RDD family protein [Streptomyces millisiae]|uniref:RDD family protein n=1 Tax=Streptomyces millisiae TaxID=3075542 RepID=A0ABU2LZ68_9ACTN|nr:RDD family protein [Streptomyces sp. DSM 44918]MDT0322593.1 RDD family protein [Streptomyces sp. DSM 44918]